MKTCMSLHIEQINHLIEFGKSQLPSGCFFYASAGVLIVAGLWSVRRWLFKTKNEAQRALVVTMKAVAAVGYGGIQDIQIVNEIPRPSVESSDEVLVKIKAASVDVLDLRIAQGYGKVLRKHLNRFNKHCASEFPLPLGRDAAGTVVEVGDDVSSVEIGDEVWLFSEYWQPGLMADYVVVKEDQVERKPKVLSPEIAASLPYVALATLDVLIHQAKLGPGNTSGKRVLIHAGNTSYGILSIQLVKSWGGHVTTTVPTVGLPLVRLYGADDVIVYSVVDFEEELKKRKKFDVVLNTVGSILHESCVSVCVQDGRVVSMVTTPVLLDAYGVVVGTLACLCLKLKAILLQLFGKPSLKYLRFDLKSLKLLAKMIEDEQVEPVVEQVYELEDALDAFERLTEGTIIGRSVIRISKD